MARGVVDRWAARRAARWRRLALAAAVALAGPAAACAPPRVECPKKKYEAPDERFVFFTLGKSELNADGYYTLGYVAAQLDADPTLHVLVVGHADAHGKSEANREISFRRARVVRKMLMEHGVKEARILIAAPREMSEATSAQLSRRADLFVYDPVQDEASKRLGYAVEVRQE